MSLISEKPYLCFVCGERFTIEEQTFHTGKTGNPPCSAEKGEIFFNDAQWTNVEAIIERDRRRKVRNES